jgi:1-acyl-sn-glycerol-3-phosphate acyltransferase
MQHWQLKPARNIGLPMDHQLNSARREGGLPAATLHLLSYFTIKTYLQLFHRLTVVGKQHLPKSGPYVLVSNHASHLDALVLASIVSWRLQSNVFPVAAGDTFFATRIGGVLSALLINALPVWRDRASAHGLADLRDRLSQEQPIYIIFPEGTRTRDGQMGRFRAGIGMLIAESPVPVVPCFITGTFQAMPHHRRFPRPGKIRLKIGTPITFGDAPDDRAGWEKIAELCAAAVVALRDE